MRLQSYLRRIEREREREREGERERKLVSGARRARGKIIWYKYACIKGVQSEIGRKQLNKTIEQNNNNNNK
jgi:hypothetical protein